MSIFLDIIPLSHEQRPYIAVSSIQKCNGNARQMALATKVKHTIFSATIVSHFRISSIRIRLAGSKLLGSVGFCNFSFVNFLERISMSGLVDYGRAFHTETDPIQF